MSDTEFTLPIRTAGFIDPKAVIWVSVHTRSRCGSIVGGVCASFDAEECGGVMDADDILAVADAIREFRRKKEDQE